MVGVLESLGISPLGTGPVEGGWAYHLGATPGPPGPGRPPSPLRGGGPLSGCMCPPPRAVAPHMHLGRGWDIDPLRVNGGAPSGGGLP